MNQDRGRESLSRRRFLGATIGVVSGVAYAAVSGCGAHTAVPTAPAWSSNPYGEDFLRELTDFFGQASREVYAGRYADPTPQRPHFIEGEYSRGDWSYRDSFSGFVLSVGQELVRHRDKPVWAQSYAGGMTERASRDRPLTRATIGFVLRAIGTGERRQTFQPRGPRELSAGEFRYVCEWRGTVAAFDGHEAVYFADKLVFTHRFFGGLIR
jgi:hypothetical protein